MWLSWIEILNRTNTAFLRFNLLNRRGCWDLRNAKGRFSICQGCALEISAGERFGPSVTPLGTVPTASVIPPDTRRQACTPWGG